jgi:hypothetical protein
MFEKSVDNAESVRYTQVINEKSKETLMETITAIETTTTDIAIVIAKEAVNAKRAQRVAEEGWKNAEAYTLEAFVAEGITTVLVPEDDGTNTRVTMEGLNETRESVDYEALATLVTPEVLASVSATVLDKDKFAAAVEMGIIPAKVAEMVITVKPVKPSVRVTFKAKK